jgi:hypothetical protein
MSAINTSRMSGESGAVQLLELLAQLAGACTERGALLHGPPEQGDALVYLREGMLPLDEPLRERPQCGER